MANGSQLNDRASHGIVNLTAKAIFISMQFDPQLQSQWPDGYQLASKMHFKFPQFNNSSLNQLLIQASPEAVKLVNLLLQWNPARRPSAQQALK
jgi:hypothetical protein